MSFSTEAHFNFGTGASGDAPAYEPAHTSRTASAPSQNTTTTYHSSEEIDPFFEHISRRVFEEAETRLQPVLERIHDTQQTAATDPQAMFGRQPKVSPMSLAMLQQRVSGPGPFVQPQETILGGMNSFSWNTNAAQNYQTHMRYSMPTLFMPARAPVLPPTNISPPHYTNAQYMQPGSSSYGSWDAVNTADYNSSQRTSGDLQRSYVMDGYASTQPRAYNGTQASYIPTGTAQVESLPEDNSSELVQVTSTTPFNSRLATPSDGNPEDRTSSGAKSNSRKRHLTPEQRSHAKIMRTVGSCIRCKIMKTTCDTGNPCARCVDMLGKARTYHALCSRENLGKVSLARQGNSEFDQEVMNFRDYQWKYMTQTKVLQLSWTLPNGRSSQLPELVIECQEFIPSHGDVISAQWQDKGRVTALTLPTYACHDKQQLLQAVGNFLEAGRAVLELDMLDDITDELDRLTFKEAYRIAHRDQGSILLLALRIRANTILSAGWGTPVGDETLGIPEIVNAVSGHVGDRPLPPAIDHQIDVAIWETIRKDQESLIKELKRRLFQQSGRKPWLEMFLTFFVSLSNVQYVHGQAMAWMKSQQQTEAAVPVTYQIKKMISHWNYSAKNILHHFRSIFRGDLPLVAAQKDLSDFVTRECLDSESVTYVQRILRILGDQGESLLKQTMGSALGQVTESGDHWTRHLFMHQYQKMD